MITGRLNLLKKLWLRGREGVQGTRLSNKGEAGCVPGFINQSFLPDDKNPKRIRCSPGFYIPTRISPCDKGEVEFIKETVVDPNPMEVIFEVNKYNIPYHAKSYCIPVVQTPLMKRVIKGIVSHGR